MTIIQEIKDEIKDEIKRLRNDSKNIKTKIDQSIDKQMIPRIKTKKKIFSIERQIGKNLFVMICMDSKNTVLEIQISGYSQDQSEMDELFALLRRNPIGNTLKQPLE